MARGQQGRGQPNRHKVAIELKPLFEGFKFEDLAVQRKSLWAVSFSESHFHRTLSKYSLEACCAPCLVYLLGLSCCMQENTAGKPFWRAEERSSTQGLVTAFPGSPSAPGWTLAPIPSPEGPSCPLLHPDVSPAVQGRAGMPRTGHCYLATAEGCALTLSPAPPSRRVLRGNGHRSHQSEVPCGIFSHFILLLLHNFWLLQTQRAAQSWVGMNLSGRAAAPSSVHSRLLPLLYAPAPPTVREQKPNCTT